MRMWGLVHSTFDNTPVPATGFALSYSTAKEWWANTGATTTEGPTRAARTATIVFIESLLDPMRSRVTSAAAVAPRARTLYRDRHRGCRQRCRTDCSRCR